MISQLCCALEAESFNQSDNPSQLLVFVSFSMPKISLQQWSEQTYKAGGMLVFRGLKNNSLKDTLNAVKTTFGEENIKGFIIDPTAFERYEIKTVPAVLITDQKLLPCNQTDCPVSRFDVIFGNVGLEYALKKLQSDGELSKYTQTYLKKLNI